MKCKTFQLIFLALIIFSSCRTSKEGSPYQLSNGYYKVKLTNLAKSRVYVDNNEDTISVYVVNNRNSGIDSLNSIKKTFVPVISNFSIVPVTFKHASFDVDFLTIPFKYRPVQNNFSRQFNTNLNGAVYVGYRSDIFQLQYKKTPFQKFARQIKHYGLSVGFFNGLGGSTMNSSVTDNQIAVEYDGVVWSKGIAGIIGINNFTIGLAYGYDNLLDKNRRFWLYQGKPWLGLAFGLNIN